MNTMAMRAALDIWIAVASLGLLFLAIRFVQPEVVYLLRRVVVAVGMNRAFLDAEYGRAPSDYVKLLVQDLRPEGAPSDPVRLFGRVMKVRELYSMLDPGRSAVKDLPERLRSQICVIELANILGAAARSLRPDVRIPGSSVKADEILAHILGIREKLQPTGQAGEGDGAKGAGRWVDVVADEELEKELREHPVSIQQIDEILIAAVFATVYRILSVGDGGRASTAS
jgi:hypothetical protein